MSTAALIHARLSPPDTTVAEEKALHTLNNDFSLSQTTDALAAAVNDAQTRRDHLRASLSTSRTEIQTLISQSRASAQSHLHTAQELSLLRHSLADELESLTSELVSSMSDSDGRPTLLEDIETMHRNLKELESIKVYVQIVHHALRLSESAVVEVQSSQEVNVSEYQALQAFVASVSKACSKVPEVTGQTNAGLRIVAFIEEIKERTWSNMKAALSSVLLSAAETLKWPLPVDYPAVSADDRRAFEKAFSNLLSLQDIGDKIHPPDAKPKDHDGLYTIQALVQPVSLRFKYHFDGERPTNRLDKPEWYFTHILNVSHEHRPFMETIVQKLLSSSKYKDIDAWREFTLNLLPLLSRRLKRSMPALLPHPPLLAHTIYQALAFDASLKEEGFGLTGTMASRSGASTEWEGVSEVVLGRKEWFERWMEGEKTFALDQYHEIISAPDAWMIADHGDENENSTIADRELRATNSARRLKALVEQVTDRYSPLPQFGQRTRFLIHVQLPLLEAYHGRISSSLDAFETLSSVFVRAVPGALGAAAGDGKDKGHLTSGVEGVMRLCKALVSAKWMAAAMDGWGEDLFFLELWTEINHRASLRARAETNHLLPDPRDSTEDTPDGTIFEELVTQYGKLVTRAEEMIVQQVCGEVESHLRPHLANQASSPDPDTPTSDIALPPALLSALAVFSAHLSFLVRTLPQSTALALYRQIAARLATHILQRAVFYRGHARLSAAEGKILQGECELWVETCRQALGSAGAGSKGRVEGPWRRLLEAGRIVGAEGDLWEGVTSAAFGTMGDAEWEARMLELVDAAELSREEVCRVARIRADCAL
ncbi:hypothetical protein DENSPDRAFT_833787 [Dentipellis sp. KUC8613]|nr:hypothetical protein DENSPDRAFT_833787 [Dentipellis sp. KUC8613]